MSRWDIFPGTDRPPERVAVSVDPEKIATARRIIRGEGSKYGSLWFDLHPMGEPETIAIDGTVTLDQLVAFAWWLEHMGDTEP